jgi:hypothetical protein
MNHPSSNAPRCGGGCLAGMEPPTPLTSPKNRIRIIAFRAPDIWRFGALGGQFPKGSTRSGLVILGRASARSSQISICTHRRLSVCEVREASARHFSCVNESVTNGVYGKFIFATQFGACDPSESAYCAGSSKILDTVEERAPRVENSLFYESANSTPWRLGPEKTPNLRPPGPRLAGRRGRSPCGYDDGPV